jgi:hypothetical protein
MELPPCPNYREGSCERSDVIVSKETDNAFVIYCKTCKSINVFPKDRDEKSAKYQLFLKKQADMEERRRAAERSIGYSFTPAGRKS